MTRCPAFRPSLFVSVVLAAVFGFPGSLTAQDSSAPATLQMFEATWQTIEKRTPDIFMAGYGAMWLPPPGRADSGNQSVGYDVYDRFDLGSPGSPTLYGTQAGLKTTVKAVQRAGGLVYTDMIWNHNGFSDLGTPGFSAAGGYPGFALTLQTSNPSAPGYNTRGYNNIDGDFHGAFETGDLNGRLSGLIDIAQEKNYQFVRHPVPGVANNLPAGTTPAFGRLANVPTETNRRFYPDTSLPGMTVFDPQTNQTVTIHPFNTSNPMAGTPVEENATGLLMRHTQWMVQEIGIDGFRLDAVKHMPAWVMNYFDRSVYRAIQKPLLDGSTQHVFSFGEALDGNRALIQQYIRKNLNTGTIGQVRGNRDALDFPLFFAMRDNLSGNGAANNWQNVVNASQDVQDDGLANNGSQGVAFVQSHDDFGAYLDDVAHAYTLMRPGNAIVYFNARQFGNNRSFPKDGKRDAIGGLYGDTVTALVNIRNTHGRGNYNPRVTTKETLIYERENSAIVALSNRLDSGSDTFTNVQTSFAPGTRLIELTGNAADSTVDPQNQVPEVLVVDATGRVNLTVPRNRNSSGVEHKKGYVIYGLPTPRGTLSVSNVAQVIAAETPTAGTNGTARLTAMEVIRSDSFDITLQTTPVVLNGWQDLNAGGSTALLKLNSGIDINGSGTVDLRTPGTVTYGFENFLTKHSPLVGGGDGEYIQTIDAAQLPEGMNFITVRAFRHGTAENTEVFSDFRKVIYVDRLKPQSSIDSTPSLGGNNRQVRVRNDDQTGNSVHTFLNLPAALTEAQILSMISGANKAGQIDRDLFAFGYNNVPNGNNVVTVVTYEITGTYNVQRFPGQDMATTLGLGLGDLNFNGLYSTGDVSQFETVLYSQNAQFNPAADLNADGRIDNRDLFLLRDRYLVANAPGSVTAEARAAELRRGNLNGDGVTNAADIDHLYRSFGSTAWLLDLDVDGAGAGPGDVDVLVRRIFLSEYGDANLDQRVNLTDFNILATHFGSTGAGWAMADFTGDGLVNLADFNRLAGNFGYAAGPEGPTPEDWALLASAIPEPSSALAAFALAGLLLRSRRNRAASPAFQDGTGASRSCYAPCPSARCEIR
jgi:alpha-amylase